MDKIIPGLVVAAMSGFAFVAYRHPKSFRKHFGFLIIPLLVVDAVCFVFSVGYAFGTLHPHVYGVYTDERPIPVWFFCVTGGLIIYLFFLYRLPDLLKHDKPNKKGKPDDEA
ncbi:MAG TPA: hypothetical protein VFV23_08900 [Verrucomicrobiae bacterium]|nr:hypothetical protein [Verrucomicrobiae bacterium]